jgi:DoxX-like family
MSKKVYNILNWIFTGLIAFVFAGSSFSKLIGLEEAVQKAAEFGISKSTYFYLGVIELIALILFIIPRTSLLGFLLLAAYMGGAIATHLQHGESVMAPVIVQIILWMVAAFRLPELRTRIMNQQ